MRAGQKGGGSSRKAREPRTYRAPLRDKKKRLTGERILASALKLFSEHGFDGTTLREISADAGVAHALILAYYGSKERLWRAAIDRLFQRFRHELSLDGLRKLKRFNAESLKEFICSYVHYCARHPEHVRIMVHESLHDSERVTWMVETHIRQAHAAVIPLLNRAMADGMLCRMPILSFMYIITAVSQTIFALRAEAMHLFGVDVLDDAVVRAHADAVCAMLIRGTDAKS